MTIPKKKFKVLHVITRSYPFGGAQRNTWLSVSRSGPLFEQSLASGPGGELPDLCRQHNIPFYSLENFGNRLDPIGDTRILLKLRKLIKKEKFDVVHLHSSKAGFVGRLAAKLAGAPVIIFTIHGVSFDSEMRGRMAPIFLALEKMTAGITDGFISVSQVCKDAFVKNRICPPDKIRVVYSAIEYEPIDRATGGAEKRKELGFTEKDYIIGAVGHVRKVKGYEYLVETAGQVIKKVPAAKFIIVGDGSQREDIEKQIRDKGLLGVMRILGERDDVPELLKIMNVFVRPSIFEGLGRALSEGMYAGLPCVVTDIWGAGEIVEDGVTGFMTPVKDPAAMAEKIIYLYNHPNEAEKIGRNAREKIGKTFGANAMIEGIESYYLQLLKEKGYKI